MPGRAAAWPKGSSILLLFASSAILQMVAPPSSCQPEPLTLWGLRYTIAVLAPLALSIAVRKSCCCKQVVHDCFPSVHMLQLQGLHVLDAFRVYVCLTCMSWDCVTAVLWHCP